MQTGLLKAFLVYQLNVDVDRRVSCHFMCSRHYLCRENCVSLPFGGQQRELLVETGVSFQHSQFKVVYAFFRSEFGY